MRAFETKEKKDGVANECRSDRSEGIHKQIKLGLFETVLLEPFKNLLFVHQISTINGRETASEVNHSGELINAIFARVAYVTDFDKGDVKVVSFGVYVFQFI